MPLEDLTTFDRTVPSTLTAQQRARFTVLGDVLEHLVFGIYHTGHGDVLLHIESPSSGGGITEFYARCEQTPLDLISDYRTEHTFPQK